MKKHPRVETDDLLDRLAAGQIVPLAAENWDGLSAEFKIAEEIPTGLSGSILLIRRATPGGGKRLGWALVEEPEPGVRVVRPLKSEKEARALIADRLAAYERMWDG